MDGLVDDVLGVCLQVGDRANAGGAHGFEYST
jgi:hypothetical protein